MFIHLLDIQMDKLINYGESYEGSKVCKTSLNCVRNSCTKTFDMLLTLLLFAVFFYVP